jgi:hypothetical protein
MKKLIAFLSFAVSLTVSIYSFGVFECFDSYHAGLRRCMQVFDSEKRQLCFWGERETLKSSLETVAADKYSSIYGAKIITVGFFRNEKPMVSSCEQFSVPASGIYNLAVINGSPMDRRSQAKAFSISIYDGKKMIPVLSINGSGQTLENEIRLETGMNYLITVDELMPAASYITVIVSDKKIKT